MKQQYVLLPPKGLRGEIEVPTVSRARAARPARRPSWRLLDLSLPGRSAEQGAPAPATRQTRAKVLDQIGEDGPKLVELPARSLGRLRKQTPGARIVPLIEYQPAIPSAPELEPPPGSASAPPIEIEVSCGGSGAALQGVTVTAVLEPGGKVGASGTTDADGKVGLALGPAPVKVATLRIDPPEEGSWGAWQTDLRMSGTHTVKLHPLDLAARPADVLRHFYGSAAGGEGKGVRVGVIDTGIGPHPDLAVAGGWNTVAGEARTAFEDNGASHGTHVAGIIAARGSSPSGLRGLAPEAELWSFRAYPQGGRRALNYSITKALMRAQDAECDLVNLSLEAAPRDELVQEAIAEARLNGIVVVAAAGNGRRRPVASPARYATAVTALGRADTFPGDALETSEVATPNGTDPDNFLAAFSNVGKEVAFTAPGLGVISTVPAGYAPQSGTSMAAAAVTGMAARLLSAQPQILSLPRDTARAEAIQSLIAAAAKEVGFGFENEGYGML